MGDTGLLVPPSHHPHHARISDALQGLYVHDDRLGPYASADLFPWTHQENGQTRILTGLQIKWPDETQAELSVVRALIVALPDKVRMSIARVLASGAWIAQVAGMFFKEVEGKVLLNAEYKRGTHYREKALGFGLTESGLYRLCCETALPRFLGLIEISVAGGPLFDVLLDTTETRVNPSALSNSGWAMPERVCPTSTTRSNRTWRFANKWQRRRAWVSNFRTKSALLDRVD
jgi:hypothetical protein